MTYDETKKLLGVLKANYRASFNGWTSEEGLAFLNLWASVFADIPYNIVYAAVYSIILESTSKWMPTIGEVTDRIKQLVLTDAEEEAVTAWNSVMRFIHNYHSDDYAEHFGELSEITRKIIGVSDIRHIGQSDSTSVNVERSRFLKDYKTLATKRNDTAITQGRFMELVDPNKVKQLASRELPMIGDGK